MRILAVDVGTGTQDILLWDSAQEIENAGHITRGDLNKNQRLIPRDPAFISGDQVITTET